MRRVLLPLGGFGIMTGQERKLEDLEKTWTVNEDTKKQLYSEESLSPRTSLAALVY